MGMDALFDVILSVAEHAVDQSGKMVRHGNDCFGSTKLAFRRRYFAPSTLLL